MLPRELALQYSHVSLNQILRRYIVIDVDYEGGALAYEEIGLNPTIILSNPENAHAHLLFELDAPVLFSENARLAPQKYFKALWRGMTATMGGDPNYAGLMVKNPLSKKWRMTCCDVRYGLPEIEEYCDPISELEIETAESVYESRNCDLFNDARVWAYKAVKGYLSFSGWERDVLSLCEYRNSLFMEPLPFSEVKATAKSIAKWSWKHRNSIGVQKNRGAAEINPDLPLKEKQALGAAYANQQRATETERKILEAVEQLRSEGKKVGSTAIAKLSGLSRKTVYNHPDLWKPKSV